MCCPSNSSAQNIICEHHHGPQPTASCPDPNDANYRYASVPIAEIIFLVVSVWLLLQKRSHDLIETTLSEGTRGMLGGNMLINTAARVLPSTSPYQLYLSTMLEKLTSRHRTGVARVVSHQCANYDPSISADTSPLQGIFPPLMTILAPTGHNHTTAGNSDVLRSSVDDNRITPCVQMHCISRQYLPLVLAFTKKTLLALSQSPPATC